MTQTAALASGGSLGAMRGMALRWAARLGALAAAERGRLALWLPVAMGAGDLTYFALRAEPPFWTGVGILAAAVLGARLARPRPLPAAVLVACAAFGLGFAAAQLAAWRALPLPDLPARATMLSGTLLAVETLPEGRRVTIGAPSLDGAPPIARSLRLKLRTDDPATLAAGDRVALRAMVRPPPPPAYPGGWDLQLEDYFGRLGGYGHALGMATVERRAPAEGWVHGLREAIGDRIAAVLPGVDGAIAATLLTGLTAAIPEPDRAAFRDSGLAHLLAIAGLHIAIVMGLLMGLARLALAGSEWASLRWPCREIAAAFALAGGGAYMVLTGMHVPILRSFAMATLVTLGLLCGRRAVSLRGLGLAGAALVLAEPEQVIGVSFQMSFSAVLALIAGYEWLRPALHRLRGDGRLARRVGLHVAALALTSALAGTASAPFAAYHFGHVQLYFVLANMVAVPLTGFLVLPAGLAALLLMPLGLERLALLPMGWGIEGLLRIGHTVSVWPAATLPVPHMPGWGLAMLALGMAWLGLWRGPVRRAGLPLILAGLASPLLVRPPDVLVSANAGMIAMRTAAGIYVEAAAGARFTGQSWEQFWAAGASRPLNVGPRLAPDLVSCGPAACVVRVRPGGPAALVATGAEDGDSAGTESPLECGAAQIVLAATPLRRACPGVPHVDRFSAWREGAHAIWLGPEGPRILSDRAERGARPWVPPVPRPRMRASALPLAATEKLPETPAQ